MRLSRRGHIDNVECSERSRCSDDCSSLSIAHRILFCSILFILVGTTPPCLAQDTTSSNQRLKKQILSGVTATRSGSGTTVRDDNPLQAFLDRTYTASDERNTRLLLLSARTYQKADILDPEGEAMVARRIFNDHAHEVAEHVLKDSGIRTTYESFKQSILTFREYTSLEVDEDMKASVRDEDASVSSKKLFKVSLRPRVSGEVQTVISLPAHFEVSILPKNQQARLNYAIDF